MGSRRQHHGLVRVARPYDQNTPVAVTDSCDNLSTPIQGVAETGELKKVSARGAHRKSERRADKRNRCDTSDCRCPLNDVLPAAAPELISVAPRGELRSLRYPDADQLETFGESGDYKGLYAKGGPKGVGDAVNQAVLRARSRESAALMADSSSGAQSEGRSSSLSLRRGEIGLRR